MLYSTGVFDLDACCIEQNHAITIVGYGHDTTSGLDYWLAQNRYCVYVYVNVLICDGKVLCVRTVFG